MFDLIILPIIGGLLLSVILAILGNFVVWNRLSYLGDSISHTSLLGLVIALFIPYFPSDFFVFLVCFLSSFLLVFLHKNFNFSKDSLLILNTQFALALSFALLSLFSPNRMLNNYFFGNVFAIDFTSIIVIFALLIVILLYFFYFWQKIVLATISDEIYNSEIKNSFVINLIFSLVLSFAIVYAIKFAGVLLVPSLLVIPALIANNLAVSAFKTIVITIIVSTIATLCGILLSTIIDIPSGPLITIVLIIFLIIKIITLKIKKILS